MVNMRHNTAMEQHCQASWDMASPAHMLQATVTITRRAWLSARSPQEDKGSQSAKAGSIRKRKRLQEITVPLQYLPFLATTKSLRRLRSPWSLLIDLLRAVRALSLRIATTNGLICPSTHLHLLAADTTVRIGMMQRMVWFP